MFLKSTWYSPRVQRNVTLARWGNIGQPVLFFPTAGGDAEEIERNLMIRALQPLLDAGRLKIYSCDSVGGQAWFDKSHSPEHRMWLQNQFHQYVRHEVVPAIRMDCRTDDLPIWTAGASIGAFHAAAVLCRWPDVFHKALPISGTYNLMRWSEAREPTDDFRVASPLHFLPTLGGAHLDVLRTRYVHIVSGEGKWEDINESWTLGNALGARGVPNYVDSWGPTWDHDWATWREMAPKYLGEWTRG
jgi:esterase/lipase superfamily enzyme